MYVGDFDLKSKTTRRLQGVAGESYAKIPVGNRPMSSTVTVASKYVINTGRPFPILSKLFRFLVFPNDFIVATSHPDDLIGLHPNCAQTKSPPICPLVCDVRLKGLRHRNRHLCE